MPFKITRADITTLQVDAIVNAANSRLQAGGGVCGAIFSAAGSEKLTKYCDKIGYCPTGEAVITPGFNLKAKYIIHAVGPIYGQNPQIEAQQLASCYTTSLNIAKKHNLSSVAFPLISSGIYGYPKNEALSIARDAILNFISKCDMDVYLVVYDKASFTTSKQLFEDIESYITDRMVIPDFRLRAIEADSACYNSMPQMSIKEFLNEDYESFSKMLFRLIDQKRMDDVTVYKRANIDRKLFSKMRKDDYCPKKVTVMALIIALKLNMHESKNLLAAAGFAFSPASKFDLIIQYFIERGVYDIYTINEALFDFDQPLLGN